MPEVPDGIILFDGVCVFCSNWVRSIIRRDPAAFFRFVPIQSPYGLALARRLGIDADQPQTSAVIIHDIAYFKLDAAIVVWRALRGARWAAILRLLPRSLRDWLYDRVMRNRYRLFGRLDGCMVPTPETAARFLYEYPTTQ